MSTLTPQEAQVSITGGEALAGEIPSPAIAKVECDILVNDLRQAVRQAKAAARLPLKMLSMANKMINKVSDEALAMTDALLGEIEDAVNAPLDYLNNPLLSLAPSAAALTAMINCAYALGNPELLSSLLAAKAMMDSGRHLFRDLPTLFRRYVGNAIMKGAHTIIDDMIRNQAIGKLNSISRNYKNLLKTTGITKLLNDMDAMVTCAAGACTAVGPLVDQINGLYDQLGLDGSGDPLDIFTNSTAISSSKKYIVGKNSEKIDSLLDVIDQYGGF